MINTQKIIFKGRKNLWAKWQSSSGKYAPVSNEIITWFWYALMKLLLANTLAQNVDALNLLPVSAWWNGLYDTLKSCNEYRSCNVLNALNPATVEHYVKMLRK